MGGGLFQGVLKSLRTLGWGGGVDAQASRESGGEGGSWTFKLLDRVEEGGRGGDGVGEIP